MKEFNDWVDVLKYAVEEKKIDLKQLAKEIKVTPANIHHYINRRRTPPYKKMESIAHALGMSLPAFLFPQNNSYQTIPLLDFNTLDPVGNSVIPPIVVSKKSFALQVNDDSMINTNNTNFTSFQEGIILIVDPNYALENKKYVIAKSKKTQSIIFRQYITDGVEITLKPLNGLYKTYPAENFDILGIVVASINLDL